MKLLRHGPSGQERPGILDAEGKIENPDYKNHWTVLADLLLDRNVTVDDFREFVASSHQDILDALRDRV